MVYNSAYAAPQRVDILALDSDDFESMPFKCLCDIISFKVFRRVSRNGDVIVIDEQFDVESLGNREPCSLSVVTFLLRAIRPKAENGLVTVSKSNAINKRPILRYPDEVITNLDNELKRTTYAPVVRMRT